MSDFDDLGRELHAMRAEPRPEYARELDQRAASWLRDRPRRRFPLLRVAIPAAAAAAAAAALVIALAVSGGDDGSSKLEVAVVSDQGAAEALGAPQELESDSARGAEGAFAAPMSTRVAEGEPVVVRYFFTAPTQARIALGGREADVALGTGAGRVEISTDGLAAGAHTLEISIPGLPPYREPIEIGG